MVETVAFIRGNLPHWLVAGHAYFVTIRLHGTLPAKVLEDMSKERRRLEQESTCDAGMRWELLQRQFMKLDYMLDSCSGGHGWLQNEEVAGLIVCNLKWLEQSCGWLIYAATLMANHVHLVLRNANGRNGELLTDLAQFKNFTAKMANQSLRRRGRFWAREDFDHWCRDQEGVERAMCYTIQNPVKAGLVDRWRDWPWTKVNVSMFRSGLVPA